MLAPSPDPKVDPVRAAIDSTLMLVLARFFMPAVVAVLGWFLSSLLDDLKRNNEHIRGQLGHVSEQQATATAKLDATVKQLDRLQGQVDALPRHN